MNPDNKGRASLVSVITTPLGFFALSLLIVEGFLGIVLIFSDLGSGGKLAGMIIGTCLFVLVVGIVTSLVWKKPKSLIFGEIGYIEQQKLFGDKEDPITLKELVEEPKTEATEGNKG